MKKLYTILFAAFLSVCAFAQNPVSTYSFTLQTNDAKHFSLAYPIKFGTVQNFHLGKLKLGSPDMKTVWALKSALRN